MKARGKIIPTLKLGGDSHKITPEGATIPQPGARTLALQPGKQVSSNWFERGWGEGKGGQEKYGTNSKYCPSKHSEDISQSCLFPIKIWHVNMK